MSAGTQAPEVGAEVIDMLTIKIGKYEVKVSGAIGAVCFMMAGFLIYAARIQGAL
ncbi:hypothetical protein JQ631_12540 [Bradyrhizobium manausense]|uniref:hypothetical protein n=1 Tax=Bradyrhizobium manausense TaxID=989370 RepID=UPI001BACC373|nr:hypothetical protein [Bradyrhizobium manausense]MBR0789905.1 hypothetical protein [Bradyrhizobium manausense]